MREPGTGAPVYRHNYWFLPERRPAGEAPDAIKDGWVGVLLPTLPRNMDGPESGISFEINSKTPVFVADGVPVPLHGAVEALVKAGKPECASYWEAFGERTGEIILVFEAECGRFVYHNPGAGQET